jgi:hypothetical protein
MLTLDITSLYTNIPINEKIELITTKLKDKTNFDDITQNEIIEIIKTTTSQNYFDLKIHRHASETSIVIYRKPTFTDVIIPADSDHPKQHKTSSLKYMLDRANKLPLSKEEHAKELSIINKIATNNGYDITTIMKTYNRYKNKCNRSQYSQNKEINLEMKLDF